MQEHSLGGLGGEGSEGRVKRGGLRGEGSYGCTPLDLQLTKYVQSKQFMIVSLRAKVEGFLKYSGTFL